MAQRRPITDHPAFAPLLALWFAALFGLGVAVLPAALVESLLERVGAGSLAAAAGRVGVSAAAALLGGLIGLVLARALARRTTHDPRPIYDEPEPAGAEAEDFEPARRPLRIREELDEGLAHADGGSQAREPDATPTPRPQAAANEGFMILTPQPVHPPRPAPDLEGLLVQFDRALDAFRAEDEPEASSGETGPDPVHAFVARQTGTPAPGHVLTRLGFAMPDHQAELRAALDKLARARRRDQE